MSRYFIRFLSSLLLTLLVTSSCKKEDIYHAGKTKNVIIIVVDGPRYLETWGDTERRFIPLRGSRLAKLGTVCTNMYNEGVTFTSPGHTAITRGSYENISNGGKQLPSAPSVMQYWLQQTKQPKEKAWIVASKDKLEVLSDCTHPEWKGRYSPMTDCGNAGLGSGNRDDLTTFNHAINILDQHHPNVMLINFKEPDVSGHANNWPNYLKGIVTTDFYCNEIWNHLQSDPKYKDVTTLIITNDHGRHLNDYTSHGDNCSGCRHIECLVVGPEIKANYTDTTTYSQVDIGVTAGALLKIDMLNVEGRTMKNIFK